MTIPANSAKTQKLPAAAWPVFNEITAITRAFCLASLLGVKQTTMANKGRLIMDTVRISLLDPEYCRRDLLDHNPLVWMLEVDGLIVDARWLPEAVQVQAWQRGLIPYVPAQASGDDPAAPSTPSP